MAPSLPPGDYLVKITITKKESVAEAVAKVVANETVSTTLVMNTTNVELTVIVPTGHAKELLIEPVTPGARVGGTMRGIISMGTEDRCKLSHVRPGDYRASLDGQTWTSITVRPSPEKQTFDLRNAR